MTRNISPQHSGQDEHVPFDETRRTVACVICKALYAPSQLYEYLSQAPSIALESALMSMSHFCFRCRRPACPQCWDGIHGVCGACAQDAHLPFRTASIPLSGTLFASAPQTQGHGKRELLPLVCIRHGLFQRPAILRGRTVSPEARAHSPVEVSIPRPTTGRPTRELPPLSHDDVSELDTQPARREDSIELDTQPAFHHLAWKRFEHVLTVCISFVLLLLLAMILLALVFPNVNVFLAAVLHIDIQAEIAYLLQLIMHLH